MCLNLIEIMNPFSFFLHLHRDSLSISCLQFQMSLLADLASCIDDLVQGISAVLMDFLQDMVMHFKKVEVHQF